MYLKLSSSCFLSLLFPNDPATISSCVRSCMNMYLRAEAKVRNRQTKGCDPTGDKKVVRLCQVDTCRVARTPLGCVITVADVTQTARQLGYLVLLSLLCPRPQEIYSKITECRLLGGFWDLGSAMRCEKKTHEKTHQRTETSA